MTAGVLSDPFRASGLRPGEARHRALCRVKVVLPVLVVVKCWAEREDDSDFHSQGGAQQGEAKASVSASELSSPRRGSAVGVSHGRAVPGGLPSCR